MIIKTKRTLYKLVSLVTLSSFLMTSSAWAMPDGGIAIVPQMETPAFLQVEIPSDLASVEEIYEAPANENPKLILNIQNIHGNYESQVQISKLLQYLYDKFGFKLLFAEGAAEKLNMDLLRFFPDAERNHKLADLMAKNGELTGIEYFMMDGPNDVEAIGIEKAALYRENYEAFRKVYAARAEVDSFLDLFEGRLETLSSRVFSPNTRRILSEWRQFESGRRDFLPYVKRLADDAKTVLNLDLQSLFAQVEWPQITRLLALQSMEAEIDRKAADQDRARLLDFLKEQNVSPKILHAIETLDEKKISMSRTEAETRREDLPRYLFERLVDEAGPKGFQFHDYPAFSLWAGHLILQNELDSKLLFEEIEKVFTKTLAELTVSEREKNLMELTRDEILLKKLFHLEVTRKECERAVYRKDWMVLTAMVGRLKKISDEMDGEITFNAEDWARLEKMSGKNVSSKKPSLSSILDLSYGFYDFARKRESVFFKTINDTMNEKGIEKAVVVTGGFHTDGLMDMFRENAVNASILMPRISGDLDNSAYVSTMLENKPTMFDIGTIEMINKAQSASTIQNQGGGLANITANLFEAVKVINPALTTEEFAARQGQITDTIVKIDNNSGARPRLDVITRNVPARAEARLDTYESDNAKIAIPGSMRFVTQDGRDLIARLSTDPGFRNVDLEKPEPYAHRTAYYEVFQLGIQERLGVVKVDLNSRTGRHTRVIDMAYAVKETVQLGMLDTLNELTGALDAVYHFSGNQLTFQPESHISAEVLPNVLPGTVINIADSKFPRTFEVQTSVRTYKMNFDIDNRSQMNEILRQSPTLEYFAYRSDLSSNVGSFRIDIKNGKIATIIGRPSDDMMSRYPSLAEVEKLLEMIRLTGTPFTADNPILKRSETRDLEEPKTPAPKPATVRAETPETLRQPVLPAQELQIKPQADQGIIVVIKGSTILINDTGILVNGILYPGNTLEATLGRLFTGLTDIERTRLNSLKETAAPNFIDNLNKFLKILNLDRDPKKVLIPGQAAPTAVIASPEFEISTLLGLPMTQLLLNSEAPLLLPSPRLTVSMLAGGEVDSVADVTTLAKILTTRHEARAMQGLDLNSLKGTMLAPNPEAIKALVVVDINADDKTFDKTVESLAYMLIPFSKAELSIVFVDSGLKATQKAANEKINQVIMKILGPDGPKRLRVHRIAKAGASNALAKIKAGMKVVGADNYKESYIARDGETLRNYSDLTVAEDPIGLLLDGSETPQNILKMLSGLGIVTLSEAAKILNVPNLYADRNFGMNIINNKTLLQSVVKQLTTALTALRRIASAA